MRPSFVQSAVGSTKWGAGGWNRLPRRKAARMGGFFVQRFATSHRRRIESSQGPESPECRARENPAGERKRNGSVLREVQGEA